MFLRSLKKEILIFAIGLTVITIGITVTIGIFSTQRAGESAAEATSDVLREQAKEFLIQIATTAAEQQDTLFERIRNDTDTVASYVKNIYENQSIFSPNTYWEFDAHVTRENGRYLNSASDVSTIHIPASVLLNTNKKKNIELTANLDFIVPSILKNNQNAVALYAIDKEGVTRYFPNIILGNLAPPNYNPTEDVYYKPATPKENPDKKIIWSVLYDDAAGRGLMITVTAPVYTKKGFEGVVGTDILLTKIINDITSYSPIEKSYAFLIDKEGNTIAFPDKAYEDILGRSRNDGEVRINLNKNSSSQKFSALLKEMENGAKGFESIHSGERELFIAYAPLKQTKFSMAIVAEEAIVLKAVRTLHMDISNSIRNTVTNFILPTGLFVTIITLILSIFFVTQIVKPIQQLTKGAHEIGSGNLDYKLKIVSKNEIGNLASSFNQMAVSLKKSRSELYEYSRGLEEKVKERTEELTNANNELRKLDEQKSDFISIASHQLRTPLTVIKGYISLIFEKSFGVLPEYLKEPLTRVHISNDRLIHLVNDLLDLSRIERGKMTYVFQKGSLIAVVEEVYKEFREAAKQKNLVFTLRKPERSLPNVNLDPQKIKEVLINLIDNALHYTKEGSVVVVVAHDPERKVIRVAVTDTGIGLNPDDIRHIFVKFSRMENAKQVSSEGAGLGLYVAKLIIEDHKGKIWAESEGHTKGSTFTFELPAID